MSGESYLEKSLLFKARKVGRYVALYGPARTWMKVKSQYHMSSTTDLGGEVWTNPACLTPDHPQRFVGLIGCGSFPFANIAYYLRKEASNFLRATFDIAPARARSLCQAYGGAYAAGDVAAMMTDERVKLIYISSNHASHAEYAIQALDAGKHVHIEKPHVVTADQLTRLAEAQKRNPRGMVFLGFNRPKSELFKRAMVAVNEQTGPVMINWFIAGHKIDDDHWYFSEAEGGRILGNVCHWSDLTLNMVGLENAFPCQITAVSAPDAKSDFAISIVFADKSVAGITFSAKGHTFEGVREYLNAHRGDLLLSLNDFRTLSMDLGHKRSRYKSFYRDHGHGANILNSFNAVQDNDMARAVPLAFSDGTARLFLGVKEAVDSRQPVTVHAANVGA